MNKEQHTTIQTKRQNMVHFQAMKDQQFIDFCKSLPGGVMCGFKTVMKVDGLAARFGKDRDGNIFFESARSGPVFEPGSFYAYTKARGGTEEGLERSKRYDELLDFFQNSGALDGLPNNTKIVCEVLYTPLAQDEGDGYRFVSVKYSKRAIQAPLTVLPYYASDATTGERFDDAKSEAMFATLKTSHRFAIISPMLSMGEIDVSDVIHPAIVLSDEELEAMNSLKHIHKPLKAIVKEKISAVKEAVAATVLGSGKIAGMYRLGDEIEGIVVWVNNQEFKITTPAFKYSKVKLV